MNSVSAICFLQMKLEQRVYFNFILLFIFCCIILYCDVLTNSGTQTWKQPNRVARVSIWDPLFASLIPKTCLIFCKIGSWISLLFWYIYCGYLEKLMLFLKRSKIKIWQFDFVIAQDSFTVCSHRVQNESKDIQYKWWVESRSTTSTPLLVWSYTTRTCDLLLLSFKTFTVSCKVVRPMTLFFLDFFLTI